MTDETVPPEGNAPTPSADSTGSAPHGAAETAPPFASEDGSPRFPAPVAIDIAAPATFPPPAAPVETNGQQHPSIQRIAMVRRTPGEHVVDCTFADAAPPADWRARTAGVAALAAVGAGLAGALVALRQALPQAGTALAATEVGVAVLLMAGLLFVVGVGAFGEGYLAGLWAVAPFSFGVAGAVSVAAYLLAAEAAPGVPGDPLPTIFLGAAASGLFTAAGGFVGRALAWRDRAQLGTFIRLKDRYAELCSRYDRLERSEEVPAFRADQYEMMLAETYPRLVAVRRELGSAEAGRPALRWMLATGYSSVTRTLHRIEESILAAESDSALVGDALHDSLRLSGSTMNDREALHDHLIAAVRAVSATSTQAFFTAPPPVDAPAASASNPSALEAREVLREIRLAINDFRDDRVDGLIRARERLVWTALAAGGTTYLLLALALLRGVPKTQLATASAFYLVAALVGLFNRLRIEAGRSSAVEDYGLYLARLVTAPLVSGLAGVAGAFLVAKAPDLLSSLTVGAPSRGFSAMDIFDLGKNEIGIVVAAVFGLAPAQLTTALQHQADRFEQDLEKSQPAGGSSLTAADGPR